MGCKCRPMPCTIFGIQPSAPSCSRHDSSTFCTHGFWASLSLDPGTNRRHKTWLKKRIMQRVQVIAATVLKLTCLVWCDWLVTIMSTGSRPLQINEKEQHSSIFRVFQNHKKLSMQSTIFRLKTKHRLFSSNCIVYTIKTYHLLELCW